MVTERPEIHAKGLGILENSDLQMGPFVTVQIRIGSFKPKLLSSVECGNSYNEDCFRILSRARSAFHLNVLETVFIKLRDPLFCRQKESFSLCNCSEVGAKSSGTC